MLLASGLGSFVLFRVFRARNLDIRIPVHSLHAFRWTLLDHEAAADHSVPCGTQLLLKLLRNKSSDLSSRFHHLILLRCHRLDALPLFLSALTLRICTVFGSFTDFAKTYDFDSIFHVVWSLLFCFLLANAHEAIRERVLNCFGLSLNDPLGDKPFLVIFFAACLDHLIVKDFSLSKYFIRGEKLDL